MIISHLWDADAVEVSGEVNDDGTATLTLEDPESSTGVVISGTFTQLFDVIDRATASVKGTLLREVAKHRDEASES